jgi:hypothetical protein
MISKDKTYRTRDGREVRIYATDGDNWSPIHGAIKEKSGWCFCVWHEDGSYIDSMLKQSNDLIELKPRIKRTVWLNVYNHYAVCCSSRKNSDEDTTHGRRLACIKVDLDFEEEEGL